MEPIAEILLVGLSILIAIYVLAGYLRGRAELVSLRNVALAGFILFQSLSAAIWLMRDAYFQKYPLLSPGDTAMTFFFASTLFVGLALFVYSRGWIARPLASLVPKPGIVPTDTAMWATIVVLTVSAAVLRFAVFIPYINILGEIMGTAVAGAAAGFAGWLIGRNLTNVLVLGAAFVVIVTNLGIGMTGEYGRRSIVTIGLGVIIGLYYAKLRYLSPARTLTLLTAAAVPVLLFTAAYTSIRGGDVRRGNFFQFVRAMASGGSIKGGLADFDGQGTGGVSLWLIEFFGPEGAREPTPFRAFRYFIVYPVPRAFFEEKPLPLSIEIPVLANATGVAVGSITIGPGIIGHTFADGGWHIVVFYAVLGGVLLRIGDEVIRRSPHAPFVVLPAGSMLGQVFSIPRGESSSMLFLAVFGTVTCYIYVAGIGRVLQYFGYAEAGNPDIEDLGDSVLDEGWPDDSGDGSIIDPTLAQSYASQD